MMLQNIRLAVLSSMFIVSVACGAPSDQQPAASQPGAPENAPAETIPSTGSAAGPVGNQTPAKPAEPMMMLMDVPAGTPLEVTLETPAASDTSRPEDPVRGKVAQAVVISGMTVIPAGAPVKGTVVAAERSGRVKGRASIAIRFNEVDVATTPYKIQTTRIVREAEATKGEDAKKIGIGAGVGTAIGAITGGKKGAAIGAGAGAAAGSGAVLATRGEEVRIPAGATLRTTIDETVRINAPM
jgi:hypothetical protein